MSVHSAMNSNRRYTVIFKNKEHEAFYMNCLSKCKRQDVYHKALIYCLGISSDTRQCVERIYDFDKDSVRTECLGGRLDHQRQCQSDTLGIQSFL